ncbi:MAG: flagellar motor protein [Gammaproteobacteria bacterium]|nr:flagellar motor protein [Gammaproteobacteria bacterium]
MDLLSIIGLLIAGIAVVGGFLIEGGSIEVLLNGPALLIVFGGTFGAAMVQSNVSQFSHALKMMLWVFFPPRNGAQQMIKRIIEWSNIARKEGLLGLETVAETEPDVFARKGLQLLVDGNDPDVIRRVLQVEINSKKHYDNQAAGIVESMGRYSVIAGIIAAVIGLMQASHYTQFPGALSGGIEAALTALVYGFCSAQFVFAPFAGKLKYAISAQARIQEMLLEGVLSIAEGENPRNIETKLRGFIT